MKVTSEWVKNYQSVVDNGRTDSVVMDLPLTKEGDDTGATALEFSVMALAGCITTIFAVVAKAMRLDYERLKAVIDANKPDEAPTVTNANIILTIKTNVSKDKVEKCFKRTLDMCPVGKLFEQAGVDLTHEIIMK
jgi:putative redox protein